LNNCLLMVPLSSLVKPGSLIPDSDASATSPSAPGRDYLSVSLTCYRLVLFYQGRRAASTLPACRTERLCGPTSMDIHVCWLLATSSLWFLVFRMNGQI
jgi:hypothetical protein